MSGRQWTSPGVRGTFRTCTCGSEREGSPNFLLGKVVRGSLAGLAIHFRRTLCKFLETVSCPAIANFREISRKFTSSRDLAAGGRGPVHVISGARRRTQGAHTALGKRAARGICARIHGARDRDWCDGTPRRALWSSALVVRGPNKLLLANAWWLADALCVYRKFYLAGTASTVRSQISREISGILSSHILADFQQNF